MPEEKKEAMDFSEAWEVGKAQEAFERRNGFVNQCVQGFQMGFQDAVHMAERSKHLAAAANMSRKFEAQSTSKENQKLSKTEKEEAEKNAEAQKRVEERVKRGLPPGGEDLLRQMQQEAMRQKSAEKEFA